jgi:hypothetical protein
MRVAAMQADAGIPASWSAICEDVLHPISAYTAGGDGVCGVPMAKVSAGLNARYSEIQRLPDIDTVSSAMQTSSFSSRRMRIQVS